VTGREVADHLRRRVVLGDGRRRFRRAGAGVARTFVAVIVIAVGSGACAGPARTPVPPGPIGQIVAQADSSAPPVECRGLARDRCLSAGAIEGEVGGVDVADIERVIVSCEGAPCTAAGGAMRMDVLLRDGTTVEVARGGYGEFVQP